MRSGDVLAREDHFGDDGFLSYPDPIRGDRFLWLLSSDLFQAALSAWPRAGSLVH